MKKYSKILLTGLLVSTTAYATISEKIDFKLKNYDDIKVLKKVDNILTSVKEEGIVKDIKVKAMKWAEVNELLDTLISKRNYQDAYILFKHIDFDQKLEDFKSYLTFFQIINKIESHHTNFDNIENIHSNFLLTHLFKNFFILVEKEKIKDVSILEKIKISLTEIQNKYFSLNEKNRIRYKIALLEGQYIKSLKIMESIKVLNKEDLKYKRNTYKVLEFIQEHFFKNYLNSTHSSFKDYNLLYRTNPTTCEKGK
jgi:hypothetical protein